MSNGHHHSTDQTNNQSASQSINLLPHSNNYDLVAPYPIGVTTMYFVKITWSVCLLASVIFLS